MGDAMFISDQAPYRRQKEHPALRPFQCQDQHQCLNQILDPHQHLVVCLAM